MSPPRPPTAATPYEDHRGYVLTVLARRCGWLDPSDREALFHDAYAVFLEKQRDGSLDVSAMRPPQVRAYLTQTSLNKAMDEGKRAGRRRSVSLDDEELGIEPADPQRSMDEGLAARFEDARVREIVAKLPERQQLVIKLRFFFNRTPQEIQRYMGITERVYRRELERASRQLAERFELLRDGTFCESQRSLVLAYVTGVAGPNRKAEARRHLETCPACASWVLELRAATRRAAAVIPAPILVLPAHRWLVRLASAGHSARHRAGAAIDGVREHGTRALVRADPSQVVAFGGARPGAVAAIVTGCLAAGSTATYCAVQGLPAPLRSLIGAPPVTHRAGHRHQGRRVVTRHNAVGTSTAAAITPPPVSQQTVPTVQPRVTHATPPGHSRTRAVLVRSRNHAASAPARTTAGGNSSTTALRVQRQTNPEFGLGGNSSTTSAGSPSPSSGGTSSSGTGSSSGAGSAASPKPRPKPLPEFDP